MFPTSSPTPDECIAAENRAVSAALQRAIVTQDWAQYFRDLLTLATDPTTYNLRAAELLLFYKFGEPPANLTLPTSVTKTDLDEAVEAFQRRIADQHPED